ncbi:Uncharacterised protein [Stenotrophomonas maltophilia]|nr:Uncharacterised protein [Stenotrophomonas maltophilia]
MQAEEGRQQGQRHHGRHDQRGPGVVQEQPQHQEHQHCAFQQVAEDGFQRGRDQPRAVVERLDADPGRQLVGLDLGDARMQGVEHVGRVLALAHQHHAEHRIVVVVLTDQALARQAGVGDVGQVTHQDRRAPALRNHHAADVGRRAHQADATDQELLLSAFHVAAARIRAALLQRLGELTEADASVPQLVQVRLDLEGTREAAETDHIGHARHGAQAALHRPFLHGAQLGWRHVRAFQHITVDLTYRRAHRLQFRGHPFRQLHALQALQHLLAREVVIGLVVEGQDDHRQAELRMREHPHRMRDAGQRHFQWHRHLALDLFGGTARVQRHHCYLGVGYIREGFHRQYAERGNASTHEQQQCQHHHQWLAQAVGNQAIDHGAACPVPVLAAAGALSASCCSSRPPSTTTLAPAARPSRTHSRPSPSSSACTA